MTPTMLGISGIPVPPTPPRATAPVPPMPPAISAHAPHPAGAAPSAATANSAANAALAADRTRSRILVLRRRWACGRRAEEIDAEREPVLLRHAAGVAFLQLDGAPVEGLHRFHSALLGQRGQLADRFLGKGVVVNAALEERRAGAEHVVRGGRDVITQVVREVVELLVEPAARNKGLDVEYRPVLLVHVHDPETQQLVENGPRPDVLAYPLHQPFEGGPASLARQPRQRQRMPLL